MATAPRDEQSSSLEVRLNGLERLLRAQAARIATQEAEIAQLRAAELSAARSSMPMPPAAAVEAATVATPVERDQPAVRTRTSRRALLKLGGAAAAAGVATVAAGASELAHPGTAHATGVAWQTGMVNADNQTVVEPANGSFPDTTLLTVRVGTTSNPNTPLTGANQAAIAVYDCTTAGAYGVYATSTANTAVYAITNSSGGAAVKGYAATVASSSVAGVEGEGVAGVGVFGHSSTAQGVYGVSGSATGVYGTSTNGSGVWGDGTSSVGVFGTTVSGPAAIIGNASSGTTGDGVQGISQSQAGVSGSSINGSGVRGHSSNGIGVYGIADGTSLVGVQGYANSTTNPNVSGVLGTAQAGTGVQGNSVSGYGVYATSSSQTAVYGFSASVYGAFFQGGRAPIVLAPSLTAGAPTSDEHLVGELYVDSAGIIWSCTVRGTPGTWVRLTPTSPGTVHGVLTYLSAPIRIFDSRAGTTAPLPATKGALAAGSTTTIQVTGASVGGLAVPAGASGVFGNLTVTNAKGPGDLILWPHGAAQPNTSNINYVGSQTVANSFNVGLSSGGAMDLFVHVGSTDAIIDIAGYVV
jgi:hypothetical protein